jgi:hypothetical protein
VQGEYIIKMINEWRAKHYDEVEAKPEAVAAFNAYVKEGLSKTAWVGGCQSWYLDPDGDPILWPYTWGQWVKEMQTPEFSDMVTKRFDQNEKDEQAA